MQDKKYERGRIDSFYKCLYFSCTNIYLAPSKCKVINTGELKWT